MNVFRPFLRSLFSVCVLCAATSSVYAGLMANWNFDAGSLADSSGNGRTLKTDHGSAVYVANGSGKALDAYKDSFYYDFGNSAQLNNFTISLWTKTGVGSQGWKNYWTLLSDITQTGTSNDYAGLRFQLRDGGSGTVSGYSIYNGGGSANYPAISEIQRFDQAFDQNLPLPFADYQHVVFTVNDGAAKLYIDGTVAWSGTWSSTKQIGIFSLAGCRNSSDRDITAQMDAVSVYNCGLSAEEVGILNAAGSAANTAFQIQYARTISGTENWAASKWTRTMTTQTTAGTANQAWTSDSFATLTSSAAATININEDVRATKLTTNKDNSKIVSLNVADGKTLTVNQMVGAFTKTGDGTMVITGKADLGGNLKVTVADGVLDLSSPNAQIFATTYRNGDARVTVQTDGTLKCNNFSGYNYSLGCLRSEAPARVIDGGTVQITNTSSHEESGAFTVSTKGGTLEIVNSGVTVTFKPYKNDGYTDDTHKTKRPEYAECATALNGDLTIAGVGNVTLNGRLTGTGDLIVNTTGTVTLSNPLNDFTGDVIVNSGSFVLTTSEALNGKVIAGSGAPEITVEKVEAKAEKTIDLVDYEGFKVKNLTSSEGAQMLVTVDENGESNALELSGNAELTAGMFDFEFEGALADLNEFSVLNANKITVPETLATLDSLVADSWKGIVLLDPIYTSGVLTALNASINPNYVPEPATWVLLVLGLGLLFTLRRR